MVQIKNPFHNAGLARDTVRKIELLTGLRVDSIRNDGIFWIVYCYFEKEIIMEASFIKDTSIFF